jgi:transcriptional antiterminator NusG
MSYPKAFSADVLAELLSEAAKAELAKPAATYDPRNAEIDGGVVSWCVVSVFSRDAEAELAKRRFGIFVPAVEETVISRGRKIERHVPLVPGYVFVLLWLTDANWLRVVNTPAVDKIIGWVTDEEIDRLRFFENCEQMDAKQRRKAVVRVIQGARRRPRPSRRARKTRKQRKAQQPA